jgi:hypothetical protein
MYNDSVEFETLKGMTINSFNDGEIPQKDDDEIIFNMSDGNKYKMHHYQDCCEHVSIEDICGDMEDLLNSEILQAEEVSSNENPEGVNPEYQDSFTWTFYKLGTNKGSVTIRWYGESNGYYSESVDFEKIKEQN